MRQIICKKKKSIFWLLPVVLLPFAEIHCSRSETTNQSQEECLSSVNHARVRPNSRLPVLTPEKQPKLPISRVAPAHHKTKKGKRKKWWR